MDNSTYYSMTQAIRRIAEEEQKKKGDDYAISNQEGDDPDRLWNFKTVDNICRELGLDSPDLAPGIRAWAVYFLKHLCALTSAMKGKELKSESIYYRAADLHNYIDLGAAIAVEIQEKKEGKLWVRGADPCNTHQVTPGLGGKRVDVSVAGHDERHKLTVEGKE